MPKRDTLAGRVGALLQDARARREISQTTLAEWAGTTQQRVSDVERGATRTTSQLDRLFAALGLQIRVEAEPMGTDLDPASRPAG